ncbi:LuxR C-terminal-related transcriptional regulator [Prevotella copri]|uniref:helix-turn-helix transcriptional regulator n=1 Tax=Segatella copri TaxID=165179 RepID=UPI001C392096|nr:LuxR C-terminal-related transcriptional regulator [Segatella copri]MBV3402129.1 LuxR C-terminal-related transcriptional regulator [Segatella copri]
MKAKNKLWDWCLRLEHHLCPDYCGVVDRRRVIAFVLLTLIEIVIIPYNFLLFYIKDAWVGFSFNLTHTLALALLMYVVLKRKVVFKTGISLLYILVFVKLAIDSMLCLHYQGDRDNLSVMSNIFIMFILAITAQSQQLNRTTLGFAVALLPVVAVALSHTQISVLLFSIKAVLVGFLMILYVWIYNWEPVITKELRQPKQLREEEKKALHMLADLKDEEKDKTVNLLSRLSSEQQQNILDRAAEQLKTSELSKKAWDLVCADLINSEKQICQMVLEGKMLKEICIELNKSESNITSQRSHIRKKLNMDRKDDLKRELEKRFYEARYKVESSCNNKKG